VAKDDVLAVVVELAEGDESAALEHDSRGAGELEALRVGEDAGLFFADEDAACAPCGEVSRGPGVDGLLTGLGAVKELGQTKDDAHQVVRTALVVGLLHRRRDLVVGLGDDVFDADQRGVVTERAKRINTCHCLSSNSGVGPGKWHGASTAIEGFANDVSLISYMKCLPDCISPP
jgi:hypothetical protein